MSQRDTVLIAGGGIGGLTAAIALGRKGRPTKVMERADAFGAIGYGIQLGPNAFHMFEKIGLAEDMLRYASLPDDILAYDALTGKKLLRVPLGAAVRERYGQPYAVIHRGDLHKVLVDACNRLGTVELQSGCELASFEDLGDGVRVLTATGESLEGAALIGSDGIHSTVRTQILGPWKEEPIGYAAFRRVVPMEEVPARFAPNSVVCWCGPGFHLVHYPLRGGKLFNMVAVTRYEPSDDPEALPKRLLEGYSRSCEPMQALVQYMDFGRHWPIKDITPPSSWSRGRVAIIGDAAHAMVQAMAQGACQAIEDGVQISECLERRDGDYVAAFEDLWHDRLLRAMRTHYLSRYVWEMIHVDEGLAAFRNEMLPQTSDSGWLEKLGWLYQNPTEHNAADLAGYFAPVVGTA